MAYLLDTNIVSELVTHPSGPVARRISEIDEEAVATSIIVAGELRFGAVKRGAQRLIRRVEAVLAALAVLPLEPPADAVYAELRAALERHGQLIGANDLWIAAHAVALGCVLVTADAGFSRVSGLKTENWIERTGGP
jgi:tRNA(fMet)-specific endonuclease VapC